jgi:hypothetical protein
MPQVPPLAQGAMPVLGHFAAALRWYATRDRRFGV